MEGKFTGVPERGGPEANSLVVCESLLELHRAKVIRAPGSRYGVGVRAPAGLRCNPMNQCTRKQPKPLCAKGLLWVQAADTCARLPCPVDSAQTLEHLTEPRAEAEGWHKILSDLTAVSKPWHLGSEVHWVLRVGSHQDSAIRSFALPVRRARGGREGLSITFQITARKVQ